MNRFDLEDAMSQLHGLGDEIDAVLYSYMDSPVRPTEDDMANMLIGIKALHNARYQRMWQVFESMVQAGVITNKNCELLYKAGKVPWKWSDKNDTEVEKKTPQGSPEITEKYQK